MEHKSIIIIAKADVICSASRTSLGSTLFLPAVGVLAALVPRSPPPAVSVLLLSLRGVDGAVLLPPPLLDLLGVRGALLGVL